MKNQDSKDKPDASNALSDSAGSARILTHHAPNCKEAPWMALDMNAACKELAGYPLTDIEKNDLVEIMSGYCWLLDDADLIGYGDTEQEAIADATNIILCQDGRMKT